MTLIIHSKAPAPIFISNRGRTLTATGSPLDHHLKAHLPRTRTLFTIGGVARHASAHLTRPRTLASALGRINSQPNRFGSIHAARARAFDLNGRRNQRGKAIFNRNRSSTIVGRLQTNETATLLIFFTITPAAAASYGARYSARIVADSVTYPIKSYGFSEGRESAGSQLDATLLKPSDRTAIAAAASFSFDLYVGGTWVSMFTGGKKIGLSFRIAFGDGAPNDTLSITTNANISNKLANSPAWNTTVYDPTRAALTAADFPVTYDADGNAFRQFIIPIAGLDTNALFQYVFVTASGFSGYRTTINPFRVRRADFSGQSTYYDGIFGLIGMFNPLLFVKNDVVWLLDSTAKVPAGFPAPTALTSDQYISADFNETQLNADGLILQFSDNETDYDYTSDRTVTDPVTTNGIFGDPGYSETTRSRQYRDYFKTSNPTVPVRSDKIKETATIRTFVSGSLITTTEDVETISRDTFGRLTSIGRELSALIPDVTNSPTFPTYFTTLISERTQFLYGPDQFNPTRQILTQSIKDERGLIAVDAVNKSLGRTFRQSWVEAFAAGNLKAGMTTEFGSIKTTTETTQQTPKGQYEIRTRTVNYLTDPATTTGSTTDARSGDASINSTTGGTHELIVFRPGATRTNAKLQTLAVDQLPPKLAIALGRRILSMPARRRGTITLKGLNLTIARGSMFELFDRDGFSVGVFVCEGRQIQASNLGTANQKTRQILEVTQI